MTEDERHAEARQRAEDAIARAEATLAIPRPTGEPWRLPEPQVAPAQPAPVVARPSAPSAASRSWVRSFLDKRQEAIERAVGQLFGRERYRLELRCAEIERRIAELEQERGR
jgi:hypothetical protein